MVIFQLIEMQRKAKNLWYFNDLIDGYRSGGFLWL